MDEQIYRLPQVMGRVGKSRSTVYAEVKAGTFPAPFKLSRRAIGWRKSDIDAYIAKVSGDQRTAA